ncbi:MAG: GspH/FimT family pseudopilin [Thiothrix sp.]|jgi:type IV fimbrial biogenesis protein FimT|uniref:GspH/FimT family pseudopilin n=1 Tax=Thiothrix sp. TaxID=1032 RepID=UPI00262EC541|nr:GspH/FimT family pseudopilin [Thiothrix sp.]MDD5395524.1 GspH/FimT family pseudopilin [Thiothrix sp.]
MLSALPKNSEHGFTLIELIITIAIIGIAITLGMPGYGTWIQNTQIRTAAESIQNGLQLARGEAVRRNTPVQFVLTDSSPAEANVNSVTASTTGRNWVVRVFQSGGVYTVSDFIQGRARGEGSSNVSINAGQNAFTFTGLGRLSPIPAASIAINITNAGADRPLRILVSPGGMIRMCDPALVLASNPQGCA